MELKAGQIWAFCKNEYCEYSRYLYIDWVKDEHFHCRECAGGNGVQVVYDSDYILLDSRWELLSAEACYDLLKRYNVLGCQAKELQSLCDKAQEDAAKLHSELTRVKQEKRTERNALVYINNMPPVVVDGGTSWSFRDDCLYVYGLDGNKVAAFMKNFVFGVSLGGEDVSK